MKKHYNLQKNHLHLHITKAPALIRYVMFFFAFLSFLLPVLSMVLYIANGNRFHFGFLIGMFLFGLVGFYLLRSALWNTYGKEIYHFQKDKIIYLADYGWFKDAQSEIPIPEQIPSSIQQTEDEIKHERGRLLIGDEEAYLSSVVQLPIEELHELVKVLNAKHTSYQLGVT